MQEERLDKLLIQRNLAPTRVKAEKVIREVGVKVNGKLITKTGKRFPIDCNIELIEEEIPWVSRESLKLIAAIQNWEPKIRGAVFMDIGAGLGGFTEVLLKNNAERIYSVDSRSGMLHETLIDARIVNLDKTPIRELSPKLILDQVDGCVINLSAASLNTVFPFIHSFLKPGAIVIAVVKPQFELDKKLASQTKNLRDNKILKEVIDTVRSYGNLNNLEYVDHMESPFLGEDRNREFLIHFKRINN